MNIDQVRKEQKEQSGNPFQFAMGEKCFKSNKECPKGCHEDFERGYNFQYGLCEMRSQGLFN